MTSFSLYSSSKMYQQYTSLSSSQGKSMIMNLVEKEINYEGGLSAVCHL